MDSSSVQAPNAAAFVTTVAHVQAHLRKEPGAYTSLMAAARHDPEGTTGSLLALGAVLLDLSAGAFALTPEDMLAKVSARINTHAAST